MVERVGQNAGGGVKDCNLEAVTVLQNKIQLVENLRIQTSQVHVVYLVKDVASLPQPSDIPKKSNTNPVSDVCKG
jgi:hypothetical protein